MILSDPDTDNHEAQLNTLQSIDCPNCGLVDLSSDAGETLSVTRIGSFDEPLEISHFRLQRQVGKGSFGTVWLATDNVLNREVALKVALAGDSERGSLIHEAQTAATLHHANIVAVFEVGNDSGRLFIASEYIDGLTLRDTLSAGQPTSGQAIAWTIGIARGLQHAHEQGVVHRDVKPSNILIDGSGRPCITDFGLAKRITAEQSISAEGQVLGTIRYMAPEQAAGKTRATDHRADIYAIGAMLFEMLTGFLPFRGNIRAVMHQKIFEDAPAPRTLNPGIPRDLETICLKCLERDPEKRYGSAGEVADELERFQRGEPIKARPVTSFERLWRWCRRRPAVASLVAGLFVSLSLGLLGVSYFWFREAAAADQVRAALYRSQMNLVAEYASRGSSASVKRTLDALAGDPKLAALRGFGWQYYAASMQPIQQIINQGNPISDVALSDDGRLVATIGEDRLIRVWDVRTGGLVRTLSQTEGRFRSLAFRPGSSWLVSGASNGMVGVWNPLADDRPRMQHKHGPPVTLIRVSADGQRALSAGTNGAVRVWDLDNERRLAEIPTGMGENRDARFLPDSESLIVAKADGRIRITRISDLTVVNQFNTIPNIEAIAVSDDAQTLVTGAYSGELQVWSITDGTAVFRLPTAGGKIGDLEFLFESSLLAAVSTDGVLNVHDTSTRRTVTHLVTHSLSHGQLDRSVAGKSLVVGSGDGSVQVLDARTLARPSILWSDSFVRDLAFSDDGKFLFTVGDAGFSQSWSLTDGTPRELGLQTDRELRTIARSPDGKVLAVGGSTSVIMLLDATTGEPASELSVGSDQVLAVQFSPDGQHLLVAEPIGRLTIFDAGDWSSPGRVLAEFNGGITAVTWSPDSSRIAVACRDLRVRMIDRDGLPTDGGFELQQLPTSILFADSGAVLVVGTATGELRFRRIANGPKTTIALGHTSRVNALAVFPDGKTVASAGRDQRIHLWDVASGERLTTLHGHRRQIFAIAVSPDGKMMASCGLAGDIRLWRTLGD